MDLMLKGVPNEAVDDVKQTAAVAVERHYRRDVVVSQTIQDAFELAVDAFREANGLEKKFKLEELKG